MVAGHKAQGAADVPAALDATARYIADFSQIVAESTSAEEVLRVMTAKYSNLKLPIILEFAARAAKPTP